MSVADTNVLVHVSAVASLAHEQAGDALAKLAAEGPVAVTRQVLRKSVAVTKRPRSWAPAAKAKVAFETANGFAGQFEMLGDGPRVWHELVRLSRHAPFGGKQVNDADIAETTLAHGETQLLTFVGNTPRRFAPLIEIVEP